MKAFLLLVLLVGCGDNIIPTPDAAVDAPSEGVQTVTVEVHASTPATPQAAVAGSRP